MKITDLRRNDLRWVLFRFREKAVSGVEFPASEFRDKLEQWGFEVSKTRAKALLNEIKDHYTNQKLFSGWQHFAADRTKKKGVVGTAKSWDIGMIDGDGSPSSQIQNIARMVNRPNKWFLYEHYYTELVATRDQSADATDGLNYFEKRALASAERQSLRETRIYPDRSGKSREFHYKEIYQEGMTNGTYH